MRHLPYVRPDRPYNFKTYEEKIVLLKFSKLTANQIEGFAGSVIFNRGLGYYENGLVEDFEYDPQAQIVSANIHGGVGCYTIKV